VIDLKQYIEIYAEMNVFCAMLIILFMMHARAKLEKRDELKAFLISTSTLLVFFLSESVLAQDPKTTDFHRHM